MSSLSIYLTWSETSLLHNCIKYLPDFRMTHSDSIYLSIFAKLIYNFSLLQKDDVTWWKIMLHALWSMDYFMCLSFIFGGGGVCDNRIYLPPTVLRLPAENHRYKTLNIVLKWTNELVNFNWSFSTVTSWEVYSIREELILLDICSERL